MAFDRMTDDLDIIAKYSDEPYEEEGFTPAAFKASFDRGAKLCKAAINNLIDKLNGTATGAKNIGFLRSGNIPADNVQDAIENVQEQVRSAYEESAIPDGSVSEPKLDGNAVTTSKIAGGAVTMEKIAADIVRDYLSDTGWNAVTEFGVSIEQYADDQPVVYRKIGSVVYLRGACKATAELRTLNGDTFSEVPVEHLLFELPAGFRPSRSLFMVCHGSNACKWLLRIYGEDTVGSEGRVTLARYSEPRRGYTNVEAGTWLPFCISFPVG